MIGSLLALSRLKILSIGEILWDVIGDLEHLGGAPLNFAAHAVRLGARSFLLSAVGSDERGKRARVQAATMGVETRFISTTGQAETGIAMVGMDEAGQARFSLQRPAAYDFLTPTDELLADSFDAIYFGTLLNTFEPAHRATLRVLDTFPEAIHFYDVNLRAGHYQLDLVEQLMSMADVVKFNEEEAAIITGNASPRLQEFCETQARLFRLDGVAVTRGAQGCVVLKDRDYAEIPGTPVTVGDTVGAGDAFAAAFLYGLTQDWSAERVGTFANRLGALVASRPGGVPDWKIEELNLL